MAADFDGYPLKEAVKEYLESKGWTITDIGAKVDSDPDDAELQTGKKLVELSMFLTETSMDNAGEGAVNYNCKSITMPERK